MAGRLGATRKNKLPFYYVQIAPYGYSDNLSAAVMMETQYNAMSGIPNSGVGGHIRCRGQEIPALSEQESPGRTALHVGRQGYLPHKRHGPSRSGIRKHGNIRRQSRHHLQPREPAFMRIRQYPVRPDSRGKTGNFYSAFAETGPEPDQITVYSPNVPEPVAVRYCFTSWHVGSLFNEAGLPAYPFRTDNW